MAVYTLTTVKHWSGQYDWSGDMNSVALTHEVDAVDATTFGQTTRINTGGLRRASVQNQGLFSAGTGEIDSELFGQIATADVPVSIVPATGSTGDRAYLFRALRSTYQPGARIGEMLRFTSRASTSGSPGLIQGYVLFNGTATSSSTSTKVQVGAVSSGQSLYAALHVFDVSASDTLDVIVQSDANSSAGGETNRITFSQATAASSQWSSVAGAVTDTWWRISYTVGGSSISIPFAVTVGII